MFSTMPHSLVIYLHLIPKSAICVNVYLSADNAVVLTAAAAAAAATACCFLLPYNTIT